MEIQFVRWLEMNNLATMLRRRRLPCAAKSLCWVGIIHEQVKSTHFDTVRCDEGHSSTGKGVNMMASVTSAPVKSRPSTVSVMIYADLASKMPTDAGNDIREDSSPSWASSASSVDGWRMDLVIVYP